MRPPTGHMGMSHSNKIKRTVTLHVRKYKACGYRCLFHVPPMKDSILFCRWGSHERRVCRVCDRTTTCKRCGAISAANPPTIPDTSLGPMALKFVEEYYTRCGTDEIVSYYFDALYGFRISSNAIGANPSIMRPIKSVYFSEQEVRGRI